MSDLRAAIESAWDNRESLSVSYQGPERQAVEDALNGLDARAPGPRPEVGSQRLIRNLFLHSHGGQTLGGRD